MATFAIDAHDDAAGHLIHPFPIETHSLHSQACIEQTRVFFVYQHGTNEHTLYAFGTLEYLGLDPALGVVAVCLR